MNIVRRVAEILLAPKKTWPVIEAEQTGLATLYTRYIMVLALIPAIAGFIGMSVIGVNILGQNTRLPISTGLLNMLIGYVLSLVMIHALAWIANRLAPNFGGQRNFVSAVKLIAYSSTPGMIGGIFSIMPSLSLFGLLASLYSLYLIFVGVPIMMKTPQDRALSYTAILLVCGLVAGAVFGMISSIFR